MAKRPHVSTPLTRRKFLGLATVGAAAGTQELAFPGVVRAQEPIRIGQLIPFTGFLGAIGEYGKQGATLGVEELNEKRSEEHTSELQSHVNLVCRLLLE